MKKILLAVMFCAMAFPAPGAAEKLFTIIHTNDLHSHLMGFSPETDYTPGTTGDDTTVGGWARIAAVIRAEKEKRANPVLVLDAGDSTMGSLFHMLAREEAFEFRLMKRMGYTMATLGNHEFDLMPKGLARMLASAEAKGGMPEIVFSSAVFSRESVEDDSLERAFQRGLVKPYSVKTIGGVKIGFYGIIGKDAAEVSPFADPVSFRDPIEVSREMVTYLREKEKVDMVICISHSGIYQAKRSEDIDLAKAVPGIDVIVSGHTHTDLVQPLVVNNTIIVQAFEYGKKVGVLDFAWENNRASVRRYEHVVIDDSIRGDASVQSVIDGYIGLIDKKVLAPVKLSYRHTIAHSAYDCVLTEDESPIGNLITDAIRWYVDTYDSDPNDPSTKVAIAVESNGVIRDNMMKGVTGNIWVSDAFRTIPLGIGMDDSMSYPLISIYVYASEVKKALEVLTSIYPLKGTDYFLQLSGVRFTYNPHRMLFDRVTDIWIGSEEDGYTPLDYSESNKKLYRVVANIYNATFLKIVGNFTFHILDIVPKDKSGNPVKSLVDHRVDADKNKPGIQELKEWIGVMEFIRSFPDIDGDGVPDIPEKYGKKLGRIVQEPSWNPAKLLSRGTMVTRVACVALLALLGACAWCAALIVRRLKK